MGKTLDEIKEELVKRYNIQSSEKQLWFEVFDRIVNEQKEHFPLFEVFLVILSFALA
jgi:hypothetical protein